MPFSHLAGIFAVVVVAGALTVLVTQAAGAIGPVAGIVALGAAAWLRWRAGP